MFNLGFAVFTVFSILLSITWMHGSAGALWLILMRVGQGVGGALLFANSSAILTDAFPQDQRGLALGVNTIAAIAGSFLGLVLGGVLAPVSWRLVFLVSVPVGIFATVWAYHSLRELGVRRPGADRLVGQRDLRARSDRRDGRDHLRDPAVRRPHDGLDVAVRARDAARRRGSARGVLCDRDARRRADVPPRAVPHPRLRRRQPRRAAGGDRARRAPVHPDHLAAGDLAARARLQLRPDAALGRHLHAAADRRLPDRRARPPATSPTTSARARSRPAG